ncbi:MAG: CoA-binding protein [Chloroflexi bacterium RBG_16_63_12]|nr:MAG: CoA-binding protein [Chloroflexi bacterium RBG_16_63_12]
MNDKQLKELYKTIRTIASVGLSANVEKPSFGIVYYLQQQGYRILPVNPTAPEILGQKSYPDLLSIPEKVDVVQLFRRSEDVPPFVEQAIQIGARVVWMQQGISNPEAAKKAEAAGLTVVMDRCMRAEHIRLFGSKFLGLF